VIGGLIERRLLRAYFRIPRPVLRRIIGAPLRSPEGFELDLEPQALLWLMKRIPRPEFRDDFEAARRQFDENCELVGPKLDAAWEDRSVPGAEGPLRTRRYASRSSSSRAALVWFHGGGFVLGSIESHDRFCRALATLSGVTIFSVEYRLAPEYPFPAGILDAIAAVRWVLAEAESLGLDPERVAVGGDSAGGNLATVAAQALRSEARRPALQVLVYPALDATLSQPSQRVFEAGYYLDRRTIEWFVRNYLGDLSLASDPRASPILMPGPELVGVAPALVLTGGFDPLRDEGRLYAERLAAQGVPVEAWSAEGQIHGFLGTSGVMESGARWLERVAVRLTRL
jgi:acetyl esterase